MQYEPRLGVRLTAYVIHVFVSQQSFVLSSEGEKQIVDFIGTLSHHIHVEFYIRMPCLLSTVFVTYFSEIREEA